MKTALYARVSTKDKGQDTENQLVQLRMFCQSQGWEITNEYVDRASGKTSDRTEFQKLFQDASQHKFDLVLFWSLDRFSREGVLETLQHLQRLTDWKVSYRSFTEQYLDSTGMFKDAILAILASIAKQERVRMSERTLAGLAIARAKGRIGGRPRLNKSMSYITERPKVLKLHADGHSLQHIANEVGLSKQTVWRLVKAA